MTPPHSPTPPPDLLEQAHLALLRGHLGQARSLLDRLVAAEPDNAPAQDLRATVIAKQAAWDETARLQAGDAQAGSAPGPVGSLWTRPLPDPTTALFQAPAARKWPKPLLLAVCLLAGVGSSLLPHRHRHFYHSSWESDIAFGLAGGVALFLWMVRRKR